MKNVPPSKINRRQQYQILGLGRDLGMPRHRVRAFLETLVRFITKELQDGNLVRIKGLGTFRLKRRTARFTRSAIRGGPTVRSHPQADYVRFKPTKQLQADVWSVRKPIFLNTSLQPLGGDEECPR